MDPTANQTAPVSPTTTPPTDPNGNNPVQPQPDPFAAPAPVPAMPDLNATQPAPSAAPVAPAPAAAPSGWDLSSAPAPEPLAPQAPSAPTAPDLAAAPTPPSWMTPPAPAQPTVSLDQPMPAPSFAPTPAPLAPQAPAPSMDTVPTDLSQLVDQQPTVMPNVGSTPAIDPNFTVPASAPTDVTKVMGEGQHRSIPIWVWILGGITLLLVIGASAYFILGIGQPTTDTTSVPAEQAVTQQPPLTNPPAPVVQPSPAPVTEGAATSFGGLQGATASGTTTATGSSAIDLLRQRQTTTP